VTVDGIAETWLYHDGIEYRDDKLQSIYHEMGRVVYNEALPGGPVTYPEWFLKDHLGNTRARIVDKNENGEVDVSEDPDTNEITGSYHYYPFGMEFEGVFNPQQVHINRYKYNGKEFSNVAGWYFYGARFYDPVIGRFTGVDLLADKYPEWSPYSYTFNNPIRFIDPDGRAPEDFVLLIAKAGAGGQGHMAAVIQDGQGNYYYVTQGAAENAGLSKMASNGVQGGMLVQSLSGATTMEEAIKKAKQNQDNSLYTDQVQFQTNSETDQKIFDNITGMADQINSGEVKYNVCSMNCTDAVERPIENATGAKFPDDMRPNKNFEKVKNKRGEIQTNINLSTGTRKVDYIPSGLDNVPTSTRQVIVPNDKNN
jgi:RHS repeat-associated protein